MKKSGLFHGELLHQIAILGHTQSIVIGDVGLPAPEGVPVIDLAVTSGIPAFMDVVKAVVSEGVFESACFASETSKKNPDIHQSLRKTLDGMATEHIPHEDFKVRCQQAQCIVRTGETSPYANVILTGGVNF